MASKIFLLFCIFKFITFVSMLKPSVRRNVFLTDIQNFVYWQNGTIPFYINPSHFDKEQMVNIMKSLSLFAFKTCLQFNPVMAEPGLNQHVLVFENPDGVRKCVIGVTGHAKEEPHRITLGYECLKSPNIDMIIMKALGFPFEHNRASRDVYIEVQHENIASDSMSLFTKETILPHELRVLPYDVDSVMHFGERDFSKNGHRTIIIKNKKTVQKRIGLSSTDLRKIQLVYGPECLQRERQAKIDICKNYPVVRRKREIDFATVGSLRVNPEITPPPDHGNEDITNNLKELGIEEEVQSLIDQIHKITAAALKTAKLKHCNATHNVSSDGEKPDLKEIIIKVSKYAEGVVQNALANLTIFCDDANSMEMFQIGRCQWGVSDRCPVNYRSTKSGRVKYSTQHRPLIRQSTKHEGKGQKYSYVPWLRSANGTEEKNTTRDKRELVETNADDRSNSSFKNPLRMATMTVSEKRINYAPIRRSLRDDVRDERDDTQVNKRKRKLSRHRPEEGESDTKYDREDERPRQREKESDERLTEDGPEEKRGKERKERKLFRLPKTVKLSNANREFYNERMWPDGVVYYVINDEPKYDINKVRERLAEVNRILRQRTCVRLKEITTEEAERAIDYLVLDTSRDYVTGRVGGKQNFGSLELFEGGQHRQHAAMMVMAMLGFYFEISRHDRDKYIRVHNRHIRPDKLHHFEKIRSEATLPLPYDYASATQPAWQYWRVVGRSGISTVATYKDQDPDGSIMKSLGQNSKLLSDTDIIKINSVYGVKCFQNQRRMKIRYTKSVE